MPTPTANQKEYTQRPPRVYAEQFAIAVTPWPDGVLADMGAIYPPENGPYLNTLTGVYPLKDTDWILADVATGLPTLALTDAEFQAQYVKATGPAQEG